MREFQISPLKQILPHRSWEKLTPLHNCLDPAPIFYLLIFFIFPFFRSETALPQKTEKDHVQPHKYRHRQTWRTKKKNKINKSLSWVSLSRAGVFWADHQSLTATHDSASRVLKLFSTVQKKKKKKNTERSESFYKHSSWVSDAPELLPSWICWHASTTWCI